MAVGDKVVALPIGSRLKSATYASLTGSAKSVGDKVVVLPSGGSISSATWIAHTSSTLSVGDTAIMIPSGSSLISATWMVMRSRGISAQTYFMNPCLAASDSYHDPQPMLPVPYWPCNYETWPCGFTSYSASPFRYMGRIGPAPSCSGEPFGVQDFSTCAASGSNPEGVNAGETYVYQYVDLTSATGIGCYVQHYMPVSHATSVTLWIKVDSDQYIYAKDGDAPQLTWLYTTTLFAHPYAGTHLIKIGMTKGSGYTSTSGSISGVTLTY
jgi:hypothetical protein